jgi:histidine triad (HIT) family protein
MTSPSEPGCIFCKIVAGTIPCFKIHEDALTIAFMDINPLNPGHALVVPKGHYPDLYAVDGLSLAAAARTAQRVARALKQAVAPEGLNLLQANGEAAGQTVGHFHIHVVPRRTGDRGRLDWEHVPGEKAEIGRLAETLAKALGQVA